VFYTIYKTTNKINRKIYIGKHQTKDPHDKYIGSGKYLNRAIEKYGIENFEKEILFIFDNEDDMNLKEAELVTEEFVAENTNYNICPGGQGGFGHINSSKKSRDYKVKGGKSHSNSHFKMIGVKGRIALTKRLEEDDELRLRVAKTCFGNKFRGMKHTEEAKKNIGIKNSVHQKGEGNSQYGKIWIYSLDEKKSIRIDKNLPIPDGWNVGRKMKF